MNWFVPCMHIYMPKHDCLNNLGFSPEVQVQRSKFKFPTFSCVLVGSQGCQLIYLSNITFTKYQETMTVEGVLQESLDDYSQQLDEKIAWGNSMRQRFSPQGVSLEDGSINQDFFKPKRIIIQLTEAKRWGESEKLALLQGIEKHGVGKWREIIQDYADLSRYDDQFIRLKTARLLGTQSLARHMGWKGDALAVQKEYEFHKKLGEELGCWKGGVLVENDQGSVAQALAERGSS